MAPYGHSGSGSHDRSCQVYHTELAQQADRRAGRSIKQEQSQAQHHAADRPKIPSRARWRAEDATIPGQAFPRRGLRKVVPSPALRSQFTADSEEFEDQGEELANGKVLHHLKPTRKSRDARSGLGHYQIYDDAIADDDEEEDDEDEDPDLDSAVLSSSPQLSAVIDTSNPDAPNRLARTDSILSLRIANNVITPKPQIHAQEAPAKATVSPHLFIGHAAFYAERAEAERLRNLPRPEPDWFAPVVSAFDWDDDDDDGDRWERIVGQRVRQQVVRRLSQSGRRLSDTGRRLSGGVVSRGRRLSDAARKVAESAVAAVKK